MKTVLKLIGGLMIGVMAGLTIGAIISLLFTDTTLSGFIDKLLSVNGVEGILTGLVGILSFVVAIVILIPVHEAGHLVFGLLTGYKFVSFRVFNYTFIKIDGKFKVKKFSVAGTGGQCLLTPPELPLEQIPTGWYNAGGVLANLIVLLAMLPLFLLDLNPFVSVFLFIFCLTDILIILMNGIPLKLNGISNDGYNMIYLNRNLLSKKSIVLQLRSNALIQNGMRPKDMPDEWFYWQTDMDYKNPLEVSIPLMHASRLVDLMQWEEAYKELSSLYSHKDEVMQLYVYEIACELAFCAMVTGRMDEACEILDPALMKYIEAHMKVMSSKQRLLCAKALYLDGNREKALEIYRKLENNSEKYLLQGEVRSDLAIMQQILD